MTAPEVTARLPWDAADPYPYYELRRREGAVVWDDGIGAWLILGYQPAQQILASTESTSNPLANPNAPAAISALDPDLLQRNILFTDGADHRRLRGSVRDVFTRSFITGLEGGIESVASQTIDHIPADVEFDVMADIALHLPIAIAAAWLDLGVASARLLREESPAISRMLSDLSDADAVDAGTAAFATLLTDLLPVAADRRTHPSDDLLSFIAADPELELDDVVTTAVIIAVAGHETTANLLGAAMVRLLTPGSGDIRPIDRMETVDDRLVTELLRMDGPVQAVGRTAAGNHTIDDIEIHAGEPALVVLGAANRDPIVFNRPEQLQLDRPGPAPLAFGYGAHYCLGAALARLEIAIALRHLLARRPALCGEPAWRDTPAIRGPQTLPCVFA
ncbi:cytochrome P450 [Mycolicibacterium tusciae]|uniref:cytochrome P450 n=1 Tax=Mycolicibacterium tusciae TaxID=75922 RepID=UPI00024A3191|nr:cytochrome P450 [Mycolicibacterium tusciae]